MTNLREHILTELSVKPAIVPEAGAVAPVLPPVLEDEGVGEGVGVDGVQIGRAWHVKEAAFRVFRVSLVSGAACPSRPSLPRPLSPGLPPT